MASFLTIAQPVRYEIDKIKGSRFIGDAAPAGSVEEAKAFLEGIRMAAPDATHHCSAWRIDESESRANDDGEPSGTAGRPILQQIEGAGLVRAVVVVTRYYGGTKLGAGGLVRAYGAAAKAVLAEATVVEQVETRTLRIEHEYELTSAVAAVLASRHLEPAESTYDTAVHLTIVVPVEDVEALMEELREATGGRVGIE